jgi:hypothetical protein
VGWGLGSGADSLQVRDRDFVVHHQNYPTVPDLEPQFLEGDESTKTPDAASGPREFCIIFYNLVLGTHRTQR